MCESGEGVDQDEKIAQILFGKALDEFLEQEKQQPDPFTEFRIATMYLQGKGTEADPVTAVKWMGKAVESDSPQAAYELAKMYTEGSVVELDQSKTQSLYQKALQGFLASEKDNPNAGQKYRVAGMYENGLGGAKDLQKAFKWYAMAAENGHGHAAYRLGKIYQDSASEIKNDSEALKWFQKAAELKDKYSYYAIGRLYFEGNGVKKDFAQAASWFEKASGQNISYATYMLAGMYASGTGVAVDEEKAFSLYHKALREFLEQEKLQPDPLTEYSVATMYLQGKGVKADPSSAVKWLKKAEAQHHSMAIYQLAGLYETGNGVQISPGKAAELYQKALAAFLLEDQADPGADREYRIGKMYERGTGTAENLQEAIKWYTAAADAGNGYAQYRLSQIYRAEQPLAANRYFHLALQTFIHEEVEAPDADREYRIARMLSHLGDSADLHIAAKWYEESLNKGNAWAAYEFAKLLGQDPETDLEKLQKYYSLALKGFIRMFGEEKSNDARMALALRIGKMFLLGNGTPVQEDEAYRWILKSAELGSAAGQYQMGKLLLHGIGCQQDVYQAFSWFYRSATRGNPYAQYQTGKMYEAGIGVEQNSETAEQWFRTAATNGNEAARAHLDYLDHREKYAAAAAVGSILRLFGNNVNDRIQDSTTLKFGADRKTIRQKRRMKEAMGYKDNDLDEVM